MPLASAASCWVGRFCCLTQELVTRLNFGSSLCSGRAATAPSAHPLAHPLSRGYSRDSVWLHPYSVPLLNPYYYWQLCLARSYRPFEVLVNSTQRSGGPVLGPPRIESSSTKKFAISEHFPSEFVTICHRTPSARDMTSLRAKFTPLIRSPVLALNFQDFTGSLVRQSQRMYHVLR